MEHDYSDAPWRMLNLCLVGAAHHKRLNNCQDATCTREGTRLRPRTVIANGRYVVGAVSDGVGSHRYSEVGARVTATLAANIVSDGLHRGERPAAIEARLSRQLPTALAKLVDVCRDEWIECCYATLVVAVGTRDWFAVWGCGDGYYAINDSEPRLTGVTLADRLPVDYRWGPRGADERPPMLSKLAELKAGEVRGAWISTDGARFLTDDGKRRRDHMGDPLALSPPIFAGRVAMNTWATRLYDAAVEGRSQLADDLGLVAFVPREEG